MYSRVVIPLLGLLMATAAHGQTIYKCPLPDGQYAYSDRPCAGPGGQVVSKEPKEKQLSELSFGELSNRLTELYSRRRKLEDEQQRYIDEAAWLPSIQAINDKIDVVRQELLRRCPNGYALNSKSTSCKG